MSLPTFLLLAPATLWYLLLLVAPLVIVAVFSFGARAPEGGYAPAFTFEQYSNLPTRITPFINTLKLASLGTFFGVLIAYPLAYFLATRATARLKSILVALIIVPFWTSFLIRTYAWVTIMSSRGIPAILIRLGLVNELVLLNTPFAIVLGIVYNYLPLMTFPIYVSLERLDKRLLEASKDLGANQLGTFLQITLPLSASGLVTGSMLVFILLMGEYLIPALLGGGKIFFVGNALVDLFLQSRNWPFGSAVAMALNFIMLIIVSLYLWLTARLSGEQRQAVSLL
ncbi:spermidine/putrescine transport system permease protein PotB [Anaerolineaceae bacterium]|nr:spermidine/putrescine transport system permease protein PotB [Anaerolineaceae bacterium]